MRGEPAGYRHRSARRRRCAGSANRERDGAQHDRERGQRQRDAHAGARREQRRGGRFDGALVGVGRRIEGLDLEHRGGGIGGLRGTVNGSDLGNLLAQWGGPGSADFNGDGVVNGADLGGMLASWGAVP